MLSCDSDLEKTETLGLQNSGYSALSHPITMFIIFSNHKGYQATNESNSHNLCCYSLNSHSALETSINTSLHKQGGKIFSYPLPHYPLLWKKMVSLVQSYSQTIIFPPPCFTVGLRFFSWNAIFNFPKHVFCYSGQTILLQQSIGWICWASQSWTNQQLLKKLHHL